MDPDLKMALNALEGLDWLMSAFCGGLDEELRKKSISPEAEIIEDYTFGEVYQNLSNVLAAATDAIDKIKARPDYELTDEEIELRDNPRPFEIPF